MIRYLLRSLAVRLRAGRALFLLSLLGVALGVASVLSIQIINRNALAAFRAGLQAVSGEADLMVVGRGPSLPESTFPEVLAQPGVAAAWPIDRAAVVLADAPAVALDLVGVDLFAPARLPWQADPADLGAAIGTPGWIAISPRFAAEAGLGPGDTFEVTSGARRVRLTVGALVDFQRIAPLASRRLAVMDIARLQHLFGARGSIRQIDLRVAVGADRDRLAADLERRLGGEAAVLTPEGRSRQAAGLLGAFRLNLTALSLISLFVGAFLVYGSTQAALVRRRNEFGLLRSLGASRGQILAIVLGEVLLMSLPGVGLGLPLGWLVARANVEAVNATLSNLYLLEAIETLDLPPRLWLLAGAIGIGGACCGALLPALDLSRREPRELLAPYALHERIRSLAVPFAVAGALILWGAWFWFDAAGHRFRESGFVVGIAALVALPLFTPLALSLSCGRVRPGRFGFAYAVRSLGLQLQTTSAAVAALAVAISMLIGITVMIGSFRRTVAIWVDDTVRADIYVTSESWQRGRGGATLADDLVAALASHPGVRATDRLRQVMTTVGEHRVPVSGIDADLPLPERRFSLLGGGAEAVVRRLRLEGAVLIGEPLASKQDLRTGDSVSIHTAHGPAEFLIAGVYRDYASEFGSVTMDLRTMEEWFGPGPINNAALYLEAGRDVEATVAGLRQRFAGSPLVIRSNRGLRDRVMAIFDQTFAVTRLLQAMSLLIAASGVTLTLLVLARERIAELALYRALGAWRSQIFGVFLGKGIGMALYGLALGGLGGVALAMILIFLINRAYFGWTIALHWPWGALVRQVATILATAALASLYPALRAGRAPATELSRDDL
jgi:putative ABC transport system permease protein